MEKCAVCDKDSGWLINSRKFKMVLCRTHYMKGMNYGDPYKLTKKSPNDIIVMENHAEIVLRNDKCEEVARTLISLDKLELAKKYKWYKNGSGYAVSFIGKKCFHLHKEIAGDENFKEVDHISGDKLDNRNENLRPCTPSQNQWNKGKQANNKSGVTGVYYSKTNKGWVAQMMYKRQTFYFGTHPTKEEAIKARKEGELEYRKDFATREG